MTYRNRIASLVAAGSLLGGIGVTQMATASGAVATTASTMTVKAGVTLNVRGGAGTSYAIKGSLKGGAGVTGYDQGNGWFKISAGSLSGGYVSMSYLSPAATTPAQPSTPPQPSSTGGDFTGFVSKTLIKTLVHSAPSTSSTYTRTLKPGSAVTGTLQGDWLKLAGGGYVSRALVTDQPLSNGAVPASRLCNVPIAWNTQEHVDPAYEKDTARRIDCYALKSLTGLENAYKARFGVYARIDLAYRPLSEQNYWYDQFGYPRAAMPGTSNHGLGVAVDFRETDARGEEFGWGGTGYRWLTQNGWKWGFRNTFTYGTSGESYHWDFEGIN